MATSYPFELIRCSELPRRSAFQAPKALVAALEPIGTPLTKIPGEAVFREGTPAHGVFLLRSGKLRATLLGPDGTAIIDRVLVPGALIGVPSAMCARQFQFNVEALESSDLGYIETALLNEFLRQRPELCLEVVQMMSDELLELRKSRDHMRDCGHAECSLYESCRHFSS